MKRLIAVLSVLASMCLVLRAGSADPHTTVVQGVLTGTTDNGVSTFRGVPFAAPPVGGLRWRRIGRRSQGCHHQGCVVANC